MENGGRALRARWSPTGRPYSARAGAIPSWGMPANSTHPRRQHKRGDGCRPPPAPDTGAMPKARVSRIGGPGWVWPGGPRRSRSHTGHTPPAALCLLCRRGHSRPPRRAESLGGGDGGMEGRPLIRHGIRRDTFPPPGGRLWGRLWKPPLRDAFGLCTPLRHVTGPGMAGRARLLCKGRNQNSGEDLCLPRPGQRLISRFSVRPRR